MKISFKDGTVKGATGVTEQLTFREGIPYMWIATLSLNEEIDSSEITTLLTPTNISEISLMNDNEEVYGTITGYAKVNAVTIRHTQAGCVTDIQISKNASQASE